MPTFLYNILTSPIFYGVVLVWVIIDIAAEKRRQSLLDLVDRLIHKPIIFEPDDKPAEKVPFYARLLLYKAADGVKQFLQTPFNGAIQFIRKGIDYLVNNVKNPKKPLLFIGYIGSFVLLIIYFYLDTIAVVTALIAKGLVPPDFPDIFQRFQYVAIGGSLFALLVGFYTLAQMTQEHSEFSNWDSVRGLWRTIARFLVFSLIVLGFFAVIFLALELMRIMGYFQNQGDTINELVDFASTVLTRINVVLASILLLEDGIKGFVLLLVGILSVVWIIFAVLQYVLRPLGIIVFFTIDGVYRFLLLVVFLLWFVITTPILLVSSLFRHLGEEDDASRQQQQGGEESSGSTRRRR